MIKKTGMTLIEIIISIALISIIALCLLPALSGNYKMMANTKKITQNTFKAQQDMEKEIESVKQDLKSGASLSGSAEYTLFGGTSKETKVTGYLREISIGSASNPMKLYTIVADTRLTDYKVATASNVGINFMVGSTILKNAYALTPSLHIKSTSTISDPFNVLLMNLHHWYVSREGFNIPMPGSINSTEVGTKYPKFPDDYTVITNADADDLTSILQEYGGKHVIYTITPASRSGKMGATVPSKPLFINGLPVIDNLYMHFDASMIDKDDTTSVDSSGYVRKWASLTGSAAAVQNGNNSVRPILREDLFGNFADVNGNHDVFAKYLEFNGSQELRIQNPGLGDISSMTVFVVARSSQKTALGKAIIAQNNDNWFLGWNENNKLGFYMKKGSTENRVSGSADEGLDGNWHVLTASTDLSFALDKNTAYTLPRTVSLTPGGNNTPITIGCTLQNNSNAKVDIAEIVIYESISDSDKVKVRDYLVNKYRTVTSSLTIRSVDHINTTVLKGEAYTMPDVVSATMSDGSRMDLPVTWNPASINTNTEGLKTCIGTVFFNNVKNTTLSVNVLTISSLDNITATVERGSYYPMPSTASATLSNGTKRDVAVIWDPASIDTSTAGTKISNGKAVMDNTKELTLTVIVTPKKVTGITLNKTSTKLLVGNTETLTATVVPNDADNRNVTWSSGSTSVASVNSSGRITARAAGTAVITATTTDGGFTASCTVTVCPPTTVTGYLVRNVQTWTEDHWYWWWTRYHVSADIYIQLSDGTQYYHGNISDYDDDRYTAFTQTVRGNASTSVPGETVRYNLSVTVSP